MLLVKNYFEPRTEEEDYFYRVDADQNIRGRNEKNWSR